MSRSRGRFEDFVRIINFLLTLFSVLALDV